MINSLKVWSYQTGIVKRWMSSSASRLPSECSWEWQACRECKLVALKSEWMTALGVQFSHSVMSDSLWLHGLQHAMLPCPSPTPRAYSNSCPSSWWCHPTISSSVVPFSRFNLPQHQKKLQWVSSSHHMAKVLEFQLQHSGLISFRMDWLDLLAVQGTLKSLLQHHSSEASFLRHSAFFIVQLSHPYMTTGWVVKKKPLKSCEGKRKKAVRVEMDFEEWYTVSNEAVEEKRKF